MTLEELARLVSLMRDLQKRGHPASRIADMERRVDAAVGEILQPQRDLFSPPPRCDHAWDATNTGWECQKCHAEIEDPPRGVVRVTEPPPPGTVQ